MLNTKQFSLDFKGYLHTLSTNEYNYKTSRKEVKEGRYEWRIVVVIKTEHWRFNKHNAFIACENKSEADLHYRLFTKGSLLHARDIRRRRHP